MKKIYRNGLLMLAMGALAVSCADYNTVDDFAADPDPSFSEPYKDLNPIKSYIDRDKYPNMTLGATLKVTDFNKQELAHAAALTNFDNLAFGTTLMSGSIVSSKGVMNFLNFKDLLDHVDEIGGEVFGSPLFANTNQADGWLDMLTAPVEIPVDFIEEKAVNYNDSTKFSGTTDKGTAGSIAKYDNQNALKIASNAQVRIVEGFKVDPKSKYTITFWARSDKQASYSINFSGRTIEGSGANGRWNFSEGKWVKVVVENVQAAEGVTDGYLRIENTRTGVIYVQKVEAGYFPDNHREMSEQEKKDTIDYAINKWCEGLMEINAGRINSFDLIDEPIDDKAQLENGMYDLKHSKEKIFWQDVLGSENYAPQVSKEASAAYEKYGGDPALLKFFIAESGLEDAKKFESLKYWLDIWDRNGAKIDGINAKVNLVYSEDAAKQAENKKSLETLLENLAATGKLVRISNFDIKYQDASGLNVTAANITAEQRQELADYNAYVIKAYMSKIPSAQQAGLCKGNLADTSDPVGLWSIAKPSNDWVRTATYKAFCDALSGK